MATSPITAADLERKLEALSAVERFEPPAEFRERALLKDPAVYEEAERDPRGLVGRATPGTSHWFQQWDSVLDDSNPPFFTWFPGGKLNVSHNCLDRHVEAGLGDRVAIHWRGEEGEERDISYADLHRDVQRFANALKDLGVGKGDVVGIFLPMIPEVVVAMLACARIGAPHNVVFGGFAPESVRERMEVSHAKALITVDGARRKGRTAPIKPAVDEVMGDVESLEKVIVVRHTGIDVPMLDGRDLWYHELIEAAAPDCPAEPLDADHPLFILYSSGSTAAPKGIVQTTGGYLVGVATTHRYVFDLKPESDVYWCTADVGWITGHSYIVYGPLANGCTSVMFEGAPDYPHKAIWWELVERYGVTIFYTAPTAIRACMKWGPEEPAKHDLSSLRLLGTVGEPINPKAWLWYHTVIGQRALPDRRHLVADRDGHDHDHAAAGNHGDEARLGGPAVPRRGRGDLQRGRRGGRRRDRLARHRHGRGRRCCARSTATTTATCRPTSDASGTATYLAGDGARRDEDGYFWIIGRIDDVINVSGHRLSTAEVESAIVAYATVAEAAVVAQSDELTGQAIVAFVTLTGGRAGDDAIEAEIREHVAMRIGKLARPKRIIWTDDLPKTRSGKIMRRLLRDIAEGREVGDVTTLRDAGVMAEIQKKVAAMRAEEA